jgi:protein-disulfide isomerase
MNRYISWVAIAAVVVVVAGGIWYASQPSAPPAPIAVAPPPASAPAAPAAMAPAPSTPAAVAQAPATPASPPAQQEARVDPAALAPRLENGDMVLGAANAPVTLIEYASLTCPHCAAFATQTYPQLKADYIDKGLVKYIYRDYPLDGAALRAAMVARCAGPERYFAFIDVFFAQQETWLRNARTVDQAVQNLKPLARLGGMSEADFNACIANTEIETAVISQQQKGSQEFQISGTPTLIVNGKKYEGSYEFKEFDKFLRPLAGRV